MIGRKMISKLLISAFVVVSGYFIYNHKSREFALKLFEKHQKMIVENNKKVTRENFKELRYKRVLLPVCGSCGVVEFEEIYFENDTSVVIVCEITGRIISGCILPDC